MNRRCDDLPDPHALLASLMSLMTGFAHTRCPRQAMLVRRQLAYLQSFPDGLIPPPLKAVASRLEGEWERLLCAQHAARAAAPSALIH